MAAGEAIPRVPVEAAAATHLLTAEDRARIERAVADVERATAGEVVVVVSDRSDDYAFHRLLMAALSSMPVMMLVHFAWPVMEFGVLLAGCVAVAAAFFAIFRLPAFIRSVVPDDTRALCVDRAAILAFARHGVTRTRDRTGVLIYISEAEHRVEILADEGIHKRVGVDGWQKDVDVLIAAIRAGKAGDGICEVVKAIGLELAKGVPPTATSSDNELPNLVVEGGKARK